MNPPYPKKNGFLTLEERTFIEQSIKKGFSTSETARNMGRHRNTILMEVRNNGNIYAYNALEAQERFIKNRIEAQKKHSQTMKKNCHTIHTLNRRLDAMEMQMEILIEKIKDMRNV